MPLLQEPVWDMDKPVFWPTSSPWHEEEGDEVFHLSIPGSISSSKFFRSSAPAQLLASCSVCLCVSLFDCESHRHTEISLWQSSWQMAKLFLLAKAKCLKFSVCSICFGLLTDCWYKAIYKNVSVKRRNTEDWSVCTPVLLCSCEMRCQNMWVDSDHQCRCYLKYHSNHCWLNYCHPSCKDRKRKVWKHLIFLCRNKNSQKV